MTYKLAIKFTGCDEETSKYCLLKKCNKICKDSLKHCHYPLSVNPVCFNSNIQNCKRDWIIVDYKKETYIFYRCNCKSLLRELDSSIKSLVCSPNIYYGKALKELEKEVFKDDVIKKSLDVEYETVVKFFSRYTRGMML